MVIVQHFDHKGLHQVQKGCSYLTKTFVVETLFNCNLLYYVKCLKSLTAKQEQMLLPCSVSLGCFGREGVGWGVLHPPIVQMYPPISVSRAAAPPIRMMAGKGDLCSIIITKQLYTCKYTAIKYTIVTLVEDRGWI